MKKCVGKAKLSYEELETILIEIEMVINSRPLTYLYEEADEALTPSHLLIGRRLLSSTNNWEDTEFVSSEKLNNRYKYLRKILEHYRNRFFKEYLTELHQHHLYTRGKGNYDEKLIVGKDGEVRGALLKVINNGKVSYINRPVQKIVPLEVRKEEYQLKTWNLLLICQFQMQMKKTYLLTIDHKEIELYHNDIDDYNEICMLLMVYSMLDYVNSALFVLLLIKDYYSNALVLGQQMDFLLDI